MLTLVWILLVIASLWVSTVAFLWGVKTGQFSNQDRARYLPLSDDYPMPEVKNPSKPGFEAYFLAALMAAVGLGLLAGFLMSIYTARG